MLVSIIKYEYLIVEIDMKEMATKFFAPQLIKCIAKLIEIIGPSERINSPSNARVEMERCIDIILFVCMCALFSY